MPYKSFNLVPLLGLNEDKNPLGVRQNDLTITQNAVRRDSNLVGTRPGCVELATGEDYEDPLTGTPAIQGAAEYRKDFDAGRALIVVADAPGAGTHPNSKIWYEDDARLDDSTTPTITAGADNIWTFAVYQNKLFAAGGATSDDVWYWDGDQATPSAPTVLSLTDKNSGDRLRPKFVFQKWGYIFANGFREDASATGYPSNTNNAAISRYADFARDATDNNNWGDGNSIGFKSTSVGTSTYGGAYATGFGSYSDNEGDFLLILSNLKIAAVVRDPTGLDDFRVTDEIANGCVSQRAFVDLGIDAGDAVYVSREGIHSIRQSQQFGAKESSYLSRKIQETFNSLNKSRLEYTVAAFDRRHSRVVFAFSTGSNTKHDILMTLDVRDPQSLTAAGALWYGPWYLPSGVNVNDLKYLRDSNDEFYLYAFTQTGEVLRFVEDNYHDYSTSGNTAYEVVIRTRDENYGDLSLEKRIGDTTVHMSPGGSYGVQMTTEFNYGSRISGPVQLRQPATSNPVFNDGGGTLLLPFTLGSGETSSDIKVYTSGKGRTISQRISHNVADEPFFVGAISRQIAGVGEDIGAATEAA